MSVYILQTDNRINLNYLLLTQHVNKKFCEILDYNYNFIFLNDKKYGNISPLTKKIYIVNDFLNYIDFDILVFLDSDAWINDGYNLKNIIDNLKNNEKKQGCFSRDPYFKNNTFINSGSFIIKNNDYTKKMYKNIILELNENHYYHDRWPHDQYYISNFVFKNKEDFVIFVPDILNTPMGKVLRHNWPKNKRMYDDLEKLIQKFNNNESFDIKIFNESLFYDKEDFPNKNNGFNYII